MPDMIASALRIAAGLCALVLLMWTVPANAGPADVRPTTAPVMGDWADTFSVDYSLSHDVLYRTASNVELMMDIYQPRSQQKAGVRPGPAVMWIHGGGWVSGDKDTNILRFMPFLRMGYTVFNVNYRLAKQAQAPAAIDDTRYALRWILSRAKRFNIDPDRIILSGTSAGAHLALLTALLPFSEGLDRLPAGDDTTEVPDYWTSAPTTAPKVAAVIDFWGITDVADLLKGKNARNWAIDWIGNANSADLASRMSPVNYVRPGAPPVYIVHGNPDPLVPFEHSLRLKEALNKAGVTCELMEVPGGGHGDLKSADMQQAWQNVRDFLRRQNLMP